MSLMLKFNIGTTKPRTLRVLLTKIFEKAFVALMLSMQYKIRNSYEGIIVFSCPTIYHAMIIPEVILSLAPSSTFCPKMAFKTLPSFENTFCRMILECPDM